MTSVAFVLWEGVVGGAESMAVAQAVEMRKRGVDASIVFVTTADPIRERLQAEGLPYAEAGFTRGRTALANPRRLAAAVASSSAQHAIVQGSGALASALHYGGYGGRIVAVEHGSLMRHQQESPAKRQIRTLLRRSAARHVSAEVAVSDFMLSELRKGPHCRRTVRIHNGVRIPNLVEHGNESDGGVTIGAAGRLVEGKGYDALIHAVGRLRASGLPSLQLRIAGTGPDQARLAAVASSAGLDGSKVFAGRVEDMDSFWSSCDIAAAPNTTLVESFGLASAEASAAGIPVVASRVGGIREVIEDGVTGTLITPGNASALEDSLAAYAKDKTLRAQHGSAGRLRIEAMFSIERNVSEYLELISSLDTGTGVAA